MSNVLRLKDSKQHDPRIDEWLARLSGDLGIIATEATRLIREIAVGGTEIFQDGSAVTCIDLAPFVYVSVLPDHVSLGFFQGAELPDPAGLLTGTGKVMRHIKLKVGGAIDAEAVVELIQSAYDDMSRRAAGTSGNRSR